MSRTNLAGRHKYLHYPNWFRGELAEFVRDRLAVVQASPENIFDPQAIGRIGARHAGGRENFAAEINAVLTLEAIQRLLLRAHWPDLPALAADQIPKS